MSKNLTAAVQRAASFPAPFTVITREGAAKISVSDDVRRLLKAHGPEKLEKMDGESAKDALAVYAQLAKMRAVEVYAGAPATPKRHSDNWKRQRRNERRSNLGGYGESRAENEENEDTETKPFVSPEEAFGPDVLNLI